MARGRPGWYAGASLEETGQRRRRRERLLRASGMGTINRGSHRWDLRRLSGWPLVPGRAPSPRRAASWPGHGGRGFWLGLAAWLVGEATVEVFRPTMVTMDTPAGRMTAASAQEVMRTDVKNAALAFAVQGACLRGALGLAGGLARGVRRGPGQRPDSSVRYSDGALALGASAAVQPVLYRNVQLDQVDQGLAVPMLVHGGIWGGDRTGGGFGVRAGAAGWAVVHRPGGRRWPARSPARRVPVRGDGGDGVPQGRDDPAPLADPRVAADGQDAGLVALGCRHRRPARRPARVRQRQDRSPHGPSRRRGHPRPDGLGRETAASRIVAPSQEKRSQAPGERRLAPFVVDPEGRPVAGQGGRSRLRPGRVPRSTAQ